MVSSLALDACVHGVAELVDVEVLALPRFLGSGRHHVFAGGRPASRLHKYRYYHYLQQMS